MSVAGQNEMHFALGSLCQHVYELSELLLQLFYSFSQPQTHIGRNLIVSRATRVQLHGNVANNFLIVIDQRDIFDLICNRTIEFILHALLHTRSRLSTAV